MQSLTERNSLHMRGRNMLCSVDKTRAFNGLSLRRSRRPPWAASSDDEAGVSSSGRIEVAKKKRMTMKVVIATIAIVCVSNSNIW
mmetsp:Transcript_21997/g.33881  ORF Transcript_21997/g.33881 Transcript_21997/m.33881 type:complete len:85 (-) Transcript_21997:284-538(-)